MSGKEREEMGRKLLDVLEERHSLSREEWYRLYLAAGHILP